jgi:hypothetical protein
MVIVLNIFVRILVYELITICYKILDSECYEKFTSLDKVKSILYFC